MAKKLLIYGATGGIGTVLAEKLAREGHVLHLTGRNEERLKALAEQCGASWTAGDVGDPDFFGRVQADAGTVLDGMVYAVGTINLRGLQRLAPADYLNDFKVNAMGAALAVKRSSKALQADSPASVVLFSSVAALRGFPRHVSMGMAKGAVNGLVLSLAAELAPKVRVNAIAPSLTRTPLTEGLLANEKTAEALAGMHPLQRLGTADDAAGLAAWLLSEESGWMTGQIIGLDGGRAGVA